MKLTRVQLSGWEPKLALIFLLSLFSISIFVFGRSAAAPFDNHSKQTTNSIEIIPTKPMPAQSTDSSTASSDLIGKTTGIGLPLAHQGLANSSVPQLQKLAQYELSAGGALANGMMVFTDVPTNTAQAQSNAADMLSTIQSFAKFGLKPVVIMEPTTNSASTINFSSYRNGSYDSALDAYFSYLKNHGVTDSNAGMWVYFPEANLPEWGPVDVSDFGPNVVRTVNIQKKYFPSSLSSIMLDAESYPAGSTDWGAGSYTSLQPFISSIPGGLLDSFGLQGFPWAPAANQGGDTSYNPAVYLNHSIATQAAATLGVHSIWLNTGTFHAMYTNNSAQTVVMNPAQRAGLLSGVITQVQAIKNAGFSASVNLFNEDKSNTSEAIDWSYKSADDQTVLNNFAVQIKSLNADLWIFDE